MKTKYLLPSKYRMMGWVILIPAVVLGLYTLIKDWEPAILDLTVFGFFLDDTFGTEKLMGFTENNVLNEILGILIIIGGLFVAFSKEKDEDEMITKIRLESLVWATYLNYGILIVAFLFLYDFSFFWVMVFNMYTILFLFIIRFTLKVWKFKTTMAHDE